MARRKVVTEEITEGDELKERSDAEIVLEGVPASNDELADLLGVEDDDTKYTVHKQPSKPGERIAYCMTYTKSDLSLDTIRSTFGGGTYRITGRDSKNQYVQSKLVTLYDLPKAPGLGNAPSADLAAILTAAKGNDGGLMPLMLEILRSQGAMVAAMVNRPQPAAPQGPTFMEIMALMKEMNSKSDDSGSAVKVLLQGLELGQKLGGGGEVGMLDVAKQGLEMLTPLLAREAIPTQPAPRPQPQPVMPNLAIAKPSEAIVKPTEENPMLQKLNWLRQLTATLVVHALKQRDPETYAEVLLDNLPPFMTEEEILERLSPDNAVAMLAQLNPAVTQYAAWFEEFRHAVLRFLTEEDASPIDDQQQFGTPGEEH